MSTRSNESLTIITGEEVRHILQEQEDRIIDIIARAYKVHDEKKSALPHSVFLRFPDNAKNRIIGLPAYIGGEESTAGMKWVASFPDNILDGMDRASAAIILNSTENGRPYSFLEGSTISAKRTAASAALGADVLSRGENNYETIGLIGCGLINYEICNFTLAVHKNIEKVYLYDLTIKRAEQLADKLKLAFDVDTVVCKKIEEVFAANKLISFATTSPAPYMHDMTAIREGSLLLHISLRDLGANVMENCINIVDDLDHVNRENTSIHITSEKNGNTDFVQGSIGGVLNGTVTLPSKGTIVYSPFGLGVLDMALARYVYDQAVKTGTGVTIQNFLPKAWVERSNN
jgi:ornithine cyclodeaminase